jgi:hypothetical protein
MTQAVNCSLAISVALALLARLKKLVQLLSCPAFQSGPQSSVEATCYKNGRPLQRGIITFDDELAALRSGAAWGEPDEDIEAGAGWDGPGEWVADDLEPRAALVGALFVVVPMSVVVAVVAVTAPWRLRVWLEGDLGYLEVAGSGVADRDGALGALTEVDRSEVAVAGDHQVPAGRCPRQVEGGWPGRVVAGDGQGGCLRSEARWREADLDLGGGAGRDDDGVGHHRGHLDSGEDEAIAVTESGQIPLFVRVSGWSLKSPTQTSPKSPASAIDRASRGAGAFPRTRTLLGPPGSLLVTVSVADLAPKLAGWKRIGSSIEVPASTASG